MAESVVSAVEWSAIRSPLHSPCKASRVTGTIA